MKRSDILNLPKRKRFPIGVEQSIMAATDGHCACCGAVAADFSTELRTKRKAVGWKRIKGSVIDHSPPLAMRRVVDGEYVPNQHSVKHAQLLCCDCNKTKTHKGVGTQLSDQAAIAKIRRIIKRDSGVKAKKKKIPSRKFPKRQRRQDFTIDASREN